MAWQKMGRIFLAEGQREFMKSHTAMPMPIQIKGDLYRIYFGSRNAKNQPYISFIEINLQNPTTILRISEKAVLEPGKAGYFDDNGVYPGSIIKVGTKVLMYYMGRSNGENGLYYMAVGLALSDDGGETFYKFSEAPIMARSVHDPWMVTTPWVIKEQSRWRMWYTSGIGWSQDLKSSFYHIKYAESDDGIKWQTDGKIAISLDKGETNIAAPTVLRTAARYEMWYSYVTESLKNYELGYAKSEDGITWFRSDNELNLNMSESGWDSQCMAYPSVFRHKQILYMLYSGNSLGKSGLGLAINNEYA